MQWLRRLFFIKLKFDLAVTVSNNYLEYVFKLVEREFVIETNSIDVFSYFLGRMERGELYIIFNLFYERYNLYSG